MGRSFRTPIVNGLIFIPSKNYPLILNLKLSRIDSFTYQSQVVRYEQNRCRRLCFHIRRSAAHDVDIRVHFHRLRCNFVHGSDVQQCSVIKGSTNKIRLIKNVLCLHLFKNATPVDLSKSQTQVKDQRHELTLNNDADHVRKNVANRYHDQRGRLELPANRQSHYNCHSQLGFKITPQIKIHRKRTSR